MFMVDTSTARFKRNLSLLILLAVAHEVTSLSNIYYQRCRAAPSLVKLSSTLSDTQLVPRIPIDENYQGLERINSNPDIFIIKDFLDKKSCVDLIDRAKEKSLSQSPVAYAGWTDDIKDLLELAAKGPVAWLAIFSAWLQVKDESTTDELQLLVHALQNYAFFLVVAAAGIIAFTKARADGLQELRTSTSTTLDDLNQSISGTTEFVSRAARLFDGKGDGQFPAKQAMLFEAPTVIRYEADQVLAPHFDANRSAETEDANRGGQTLATLLVYLNDVEKGGKTRFGKLASTNPSEDEQYLTVQPRVGDALLFFPADENGNFDERLEHEGCAAIDEKWIARIWRHKNRVPPPFGLTTGALSKLP
jgi:hypothetical protein